MNPRLILITLLFVISCKTKKNEWQTLDFGAFKIKTPQGWKIVKQQGIDSYVGGLTNGEDSLWFDYGWYSSGLIIEDTGEHKVARDTINGLRAWVTVPRYIGKGYISVYIPHASAEDGFSMWGKEIIDTGMILKMYKSVVFESSDTTLNPPLSDGKYSLLSHGSGKIIYQQNCAGCHAIRREMMAPSFNDVIKKRSAAWIYKFLTDNSVAATDTAHISMRKHYDFHCPQFPLLTELDIELLVDYVRD